MNRRTKRAFGFVLLATVGGLISGPATAQAPVPESYPKTAPESRTDVMQRVNRENADSQDKKDKFRDARTNRITGSVCVGCGGPVVPFNPGGEQAPKKKPAKHRATKSAPADPAQAEGASPD